MEKINLFAAGNAIAVILMGIKYYLDGRKSKVGAMQEFKLSEKTSGAFHISEEGLKKYKELKEKIENDLMATKDHTLLCRGNLLELKTDVVDKLNEVEKNLLSEIRKTNGKS